MTDENPQPDVLDEAIRQVDMALEQKLEALRQTALGSTRDLAASSVSAPTNPPASAPAADIAPTPTPAYTNAHPGDEWSSGDAVLRPTEQPVASTPSSSGGFVPDEPTWDSEPTGAAGTASWGTTTSRTPGPTGRSASPSRDTGDGTYDSGAVRAPAATAVADDESWAHTRTALRMLQQSSDELRDLLPAEISRRLGDELSRELTNRVTQQVTAAVGDQVERVVRTELATPGAAMRSLQSSLPAMANEIQLGVSSELESSTALLQQVAEELPVQLERLERTVAQTVHEDVGQVERSVAENVTRLAANLTEELHRSSTTHDEGIARVERSMDAGMRTVEGAVRGEFDRVSRAMRADLDRVESSLGAAIAAPATAVQQLHEELPAHLTRLERAVREQDPTPWVEKLADALGDQHELSKRQHEALVNDLAAANGQLGRDLESSQGELLRSLQTTGERLVADVRTSTGDVARSIDGAVRSYLEPTSRSVEQLAALQLGNALGTLDTSVSTIESRLGAVERSVTSGLGTLASGLGTLGTDLDAKVGELHTGVDDRIRALQTDLEQQLASLGTGIEQDRVQRTEDLETVVDTMTAGWTGMAGAMRTMLARLDAIDGKLEAVTSQVDTLRQLEGTVSSSMTSIEGMIDRQLQSVQQHIADLKPAPVVVTVNHPDAQISHATRGGFTSEQDSGRPTS